jgi:hypothetical protein
VYSDGALVFFFLTGVDDLVDGRAIAGLAVLVLVGALGDLARTVLGWEPVVDVISVLSQSASLILERDAARGPARGVMRVPLSTLCLWGSSSSAVLRRMLLALAVFLKSAAVVVVSGGLGGARGGVGATRLGGRGGGARLAPSLSSLASAGCGVMAVFRFAGSSREYMLSFACVLESVGYDRLDLEAFADPMELLLASSGTRFILCDLDDCDDDDVRMRSADGRSRGRSFSASSLLEADERVFRALELLCRSRSLSRSFSRSRSRSLLLGLLESFLLRRRCESGEFMVGMGNRVCLFGLGCRPGCRGTFCVRAGVTQRGNGLLRLGVCRVLVARRAYQRREPPSIWGVGRSDARRCCMRRAGLRRREAAWDGACLQRWSTVVPASESPQVTCKGGLHGSPSQE